MGDDDFNLARLAFGELQLHRNTGERDVAISRPDLEPAHEEILRYLDYETWTDRGTLRQKTKFHEKQLKKHLQFLEENDYVDERKKPNERREKQYKRI